MAYCLSTGLQKILVKPCAGGDGRKQYNKKHRGAREGPARGCQCRWCGRAFDRRILVGACDAHECFPEIAAFKHPDEGRRRVLESVSDVLAIADAAIGDCGRDAEQEVGMMLRAES